MNTQKVTKEYRMNKWLGIISECRSSGQPVSTWCSERGINSKSYYYWLRKIRTAACSTLPAINSESNIVPLEIGAISPTNPTYEINVPSKTPKADIVLRLDSIVVEIHNDASASLIENTIRALRNAR
ncbi:MAG: IS66 family insertion sequence element accessory protein TnpB [Clostridiaceae bacterium]